MRSFLRFRHVAGWLLAAAFLAVGYGYSAAWPLAVLGAAIFFWCVRRQDKLGEAFFGSWLAGALYFAFVTRWLFAVWPAEWLGLERDPVTLPLIFSVWVLLSAAMGSITGLLGAGVFAARRKFDSPAAFLVLTPAMWTLAEYFRAWFFSIFTAGEGALLGPHWTFGHVGYTLVDTPFFRLAPIIGVYGLSWLVAFAGAALAAVRRREAAIAGAVIIAVFALSMWYQPPLSHDASIRAAVFQSDTRVGLVRYREGIRQAMEDYFRAHPGAVPDMIVLPEDAALFSVSQEEERELLGKFFSDSTKDGVVVTNATISENGKRIKYAYFVEKGGRLIGRQPKNFLIPGGEFLPYALKPVLWAFGRQEFAETFRSLREISPGGQEMRYVESGGVKFGAGICSAVLSPRLYREMAAGGAEVLLNQTSFSVFHGSPLLLSEMTRMARFRAAENARPLIQSANAGYSLVIDARGTVVAEPAGLGNYLIAAEVTPGRAKTPVQRFGDWPVGAAAILLFMLGVLSCCGGRNRTSFSGL